MSDLVQRLESEQPIVISMRPAPSVERVKTALERGFLHVKFLQTRGGTELGIRLDRQQSRIDDDGESGGTATLVGRLVLDDVPANFRGVVSLDSFEGTGRLERMPNPQGKEDRS